LSFDLYNSNKSYIKTDKTNGNQRKPTKTNEIAKIIEKLLKLIYKTNENQLLLTEKI
jgi:hypothetical protein